MTEFPPHHWGAGEGEGEEEKGDCGKEEKKGVPGDLPEILQLLLPHLGVAQERM